MAEMQAFKSPRRARRRPTEIEVVQLTPAFYQQLADTEWSVERTVPWKGGDIMLRGRVYEHVEVWNRLHESWVQLTGPGDLLRVDNPDDVYPIDEDTFSSIYDFLEDGDDGEG